MEFTVRKDSENKGRRFRRCEDCGFLGWVDELPPGDAAKRGGLPNPLSIPAKRCRPEDGTPKRYCRCDLTAVLKTVKNGSNEGRLYWGCPNSRAADCRFFEWENEEAQAAVPLNARTQSAGSQQSGDCFNCGQPGHWASDCPARNNLTRTRTAAHKPKGAADTTGVECFKCGGSGHFSKDCPDPWVSTRGSRGLSRKASFHGSSSTRATSRGRGRGGKRAATKPRSKTGAFGAADE